MPAEHSEALAEHVGGRIDREPVLIRPAGDRATLGRSRERAADVFCLSRWLYGVAQGRRPPCEHSHSCS
jgi:hypothetical protein